MFMAFACYAFGMWVLNIRILDAPQNIIEEWFHQQRQATLTNQDRLELWDLYTPGWQARWNKTGSKDTFVIGYRAWSSFEQKSITQADQECTSSTAFFELLNPKRLYDCSGKDSTSFNIRYQVTEYFDPTMKPGSENNLWLSLHHKNGSRSNKVTRIFNENFALAKADDGHWFINDTSRKSVELLMFKP
jgi:hypothetical protein